MSDAENLPDELLENEEFRKELENRAPNWDIADAIIGTRIEHDLTQKEFAEKIGIPLSVVRKLERGEGNPSLKFLKWLADKMGMRLRISFEKKDERESD